MKANLCKCNECGIVLIDQNPQTKAPEFELTGNEQEMKWIDKDGGFWACPVCEDDGNLIDMEAAATPSPLPETTKKVITEEGEMLPMNEAEERVFYKGEWREIQEDQEGGLYIMAGLGKVIYIDPYRMQPGNERQEGEGFTQQQAAAMLKSLESLTQYLETMGDFIVEDAEENENAYSKAKALINSITGGK